jgi:hypothetical protein
VTAKDILFIVIIPLALAELGPWCGWLGAKLLPRAAKLRYGDTDRAAIRAEEWSGDLDDIPGQLTKLAYSVGQLVIGSAVSARRIARPINRASPASAGLVVGLRTETAQVRLSFRGRVLDVTEEVKARAAELSTSVEKLIEQPQWLNGLSDMITGQLPIGEPITVAHEQKFSPVTAGERSQTSHE